MRRFLKFLPLMFAAVAATVLWSCSDDDNFVPADELPVAARSFLSTYYPKVAVETVEMDGNEYEAVLANGHSVDFNAAGEWIDVDAPAGQTVPSGFYPAAIDAYVAQNFPGSGINEISVTMLGYDVDLVSGIELMFSPTGEFIGVDL
ncbi:MAG: PepSY-like domain-containing protein [Duncaniella sp.]|nr:PepSY-like domain-containing protein [Duncaniella sp.]